MIRSRLSSLVLAALVVGTSPLAAGGQDAATSPRRPVEVRVHVSDGGRFAEDLSLGDFAILEDGRAQAAGSLVLVRNGRAVRREGTEAVPPCLERSYVLLVQAVDWDPKLSEAVDHLFSSVLRPGDSMTLVTPVKPYYLQKDALALKPREELSKGMEQVLRKDILAGGVEYRGLVNELRRLTKAIGGNTTTFQEDLESDVTTETEGGFGLEMQIDRYRQALMKMEGIRLVDESKLLAFAGSLKPVPGRKTVVLFYQREYRPEISAATMTRLFGLYQDNPDILGNLMDLFQFYKREKTFDADRVKKAFADAGIDFHFIFMEKKNQRIFGATMREQSEDTFPGFVEIAQSTGGTAASSLNPAAAFKHAAESSADYYLLTYVPDDGGAVGRFRRIEVRVNREHFRVSGPLGYYAK